MVNCAVFGSPAMSKSGSGVGFFCIPAIVKTQCSKTLSSSVAKTNQSGKLTRSRHETLHKILQQTFSKCKKMKPVEEKENEEERQKEELSFEEKKKRASSLWDDFMKDVGTPVTKKKADELVVTEEKSKEDDSEVEPPQQPTKVKVTEVFEFAGEKVEVEREVVSSSVSAPTSVSGGGKVLGGISSILGQIGKKGKLSTLEKSKLDWNKFKKQEGIDEELDTFNKGKNGFLEKQDFLQRTDLRQFEIEKEMRNKRRSSNR